MNRLLFLIIAIPTIEIFVMIKVGQNIGALNTVLLIFFTAIVGIYFAKIEGLNTLRSGLYNLYKNEIPIFEIISGASIALAALFLIIPGFVTDTLGFFLLIPFTRKIFINFFIKKGSVVKKNNEDFIEGEVIKEKNKKEDDL
tara:strand:+ start:537 stop:962 length:426 start_codon:yes stop_codon:yes gene_type:complete